MLLQVRQYIYFPSLFLKPHEGEGYQVEISGKRFAFAHIERAPPEAYLSRGYVAYVHFHIVLNPGSANYTLLKLGSQGSSILQIWILILCFSLGHWHTTFSIQDQTTQSSYIWRGCKLCRHTAESSCENFSEKCFGFQAKRTTWNDTSQWSRKQIHHDCLCTENCQCSFRAEGTGWEL